MTDARQPVYTRASIVDPVGCDSAPGCATSLGLAERDDEGKRARDSSDGRS